MSCVCLRLRRSTSLLRYATYLVQLAETVLRAVHVVLRLLALAQKHVLVLVQLAEFQERLRGVTRPRIHACEGPGAHSSLELCHEGSAGGQHVRVRKQLAPAREGQAHIRGWAGGRG